MTNWKTDAVYYLQWATFDKMIHNFANGLSKKRIDSIIGIARGGLIPAVALANALNINNFYSIRIRRNDSSQIWAQRTGVKVEEDNVLSLKGQVVLLVDDAISDGQTILEGIRYVTDRFGATSISTLSLIVNNSSPYFPDLYGHKAGGWVVFPWENPPAVNSDQVRKIKI